MKCIHSGFVTFLFNTLNGRLLYMPFHAEREPPIGWNNPIFRKIRSWASGGYHWNPTETLLQVGKNVELFNEVWGPYLEEVKMFLLLSKSGTPLFFLDRFSVIKLRFFRAFSSVVRQMSGYNSQRRSTAHISQISFKFFDCYVCSNFFIIMYVPFSVSWVLFVCKCVILPPGVNPIAVKNISYHHIISNNRIPRKWIGRQCPLYWPPGSPDL
jgi:hypothetical protein